MESINTLRVDQVPIPGARMKSKQWRRIHARPVGIDVSQDQPIRYSTEDGRWRRNPRARIDLRSMQGVIGTSGDVSRYNSPLIYARKINRIPSPLLSNPLLQPQVQTSKRTGGASRTRRWRSYAARRPHDLRRVHLLRADDAESKADRKPTESRIDRRGVGILR